MHKLLMTTTLLTFLSLCAWGYAAKAGAERAVSNVVVIRSLCIVVSLIFYVPAERALRSVGQDIGITHDCGFPDLVTPSSPLSRSPRMELLVTSAIWHFSRPTRRGPTASASDPKRTSQI